MPGSLVVGIDLGGTKVAAGAVSVDGTKQFPLHHELTHAEEGADAVSDRIARMIREVIADACKTSGAKPADFLGVGVGAPGPLDRDRGVVVVAPNLKWKDYPLAPKIAERVSLPVVLDNDANCATLGEWWLGAGRGTRNMVGLTIGTGIGGGLILDGKLYHGASDVAGEIGHTTIETQGRHCACGNYGCLEAYASGPAIAERAREALAHDSESALHKKAGGDLSQLTAQTVYEAADEGDELALEVVRDTARFLGAGVANLLNVFNPEIVVLAGGVTAAGDHLFEPLRTEVKRRAFRPAWNAARIVPGKLGTNAGVVGAVAMFTQARPSA